MGCYELNSSASEQGSVERCCAHGNEPSGYINVLGESLDQLSECQFLKGDAVETSAEADPVQGSVLPTVLAVSMSMASRCCEQKVSPSHGDIIEDNGRELLPTNRPIII
jgi:hypothetical protein